MGDWFYEIKSEYSLLAVIVFLISILYLAVTALIVFVPGDSVAGLAKNITQGITVVFFFGAPFVVIGSVVSVAHVWMSQKKGLLISALAIVLSMQYLLWLFANVNGWEIGPFKALLLNL